MRVALLLMALAAGQVRDAVRPGDEVYSRIAGTVIAADTNRPLSRAVVSIIRINESSPMQVAATDEAGRYVLDGVLPGAYRLMASKPGLYIETVYGQSSADTAGRLVSVPAGSALQIDIVVLRGAAIAGRVFDQAGEPVALAEVTVSATDTGPHSAVQGARVTTNDRGEYRLFGLRPGEYLLSAAVPRLPKDTRQFAPIYHPGVTDVASAARVQLTPGQDVLNADFTLRLIATVTVSGIALGPDGQPLPGGSLALYLAGADGRILPRALLTSALARFDGLSGIGSIRRDGTFSLAALPGQYVLRGRYNERGGPPEAVRYGRALMAAQPLAVGDADIPDLSLRFSYGATLDGRFVFEGSTPQRPQVFRVMVETGEPGALVTSAAADDGSFTIGGIESGPRRIRAVGPADWVLKGILVNGQDVADRLVELGDETATSGVSVVFTSLKAPLTIALDGIEPGSVVTVFAFPDDETLWHEGSRRILARAAGGPRLLIDSLPPGEYLVAAVSDLSPDPRRPFDPALLRQLRAIARRVELVDRTPSAVRLAVQPLPR